MKLTVKMLETAIRNSDVNFFDNQIIIDCLYDYLAEDNDMLYPMDKLAKVLGSFDTWSGSLLSPFVHFDLHDNYFEINPYCFVESYPSILAFFQSRIDLYDFAHYWSATEWDRIE